MMKRKAGHMPADVVGQRTNVLPADIRPQDGGQVQDHRSGKRGAHQAAGTTRCAQAAPAGGRPPRLHAPSRICAQGSQHLQTREDLDKEARRSPRLSSRKCTRGRSHVRHVAHFIGVRAVHGQNRMAASGRVRPDGACSHPPKCINTNPCAEALCSAPAGRCDTRPLNGRACAGRGAVHRGRAQ